jgi:hypothetical protein
VVCLFGLVVVSRMRRWALSGREAGVYDAWEQ